MRDEGKNGEIEPFLRGNRQSVGFLHESLPLPVYGRSPPKRPVLPCFRRFAARRIPRFKRGFLFICLRSCHVLHFSAFGLRPDLPATPAIKKPLRNIEKCFDPAQTEATRQHPVEGRESLIMREWEILQAPFSPLTPQSVSHNERLTTNPPKQEAPSLVSHRLRQVYKGTLVFFYLRG